MSSLPPPPPPSNDPAPQGHPMPSGPTVSSGAQVGLRLVAFLLDSVIYAALSALTILVVWGSIAFSVDGETSIASSRVGSSIPWMILAALFFRRAASPGKIPVRLRVVDMQTGEPASFGQMALREWGGKIVLGALTGGLSWLVSAIMVVVTPSRRGVWDYIARTRVVVR